MPNQASTDPPAWRFPLCWQPCHCWAPLTGPLAPPKPKHTFSGEKKMVGEMVAVRDWGGHPLPIGFWPFQTTTPPALQVSRQPNNDISLNTPYIHLDL